LGAITEQLLSGLSPERQTILSERAPFLYPKAKDEEKERRVKYCVTHKRKEFRAAVYLSHNAGSKHSTTYSLGNSAWPTGAPIIARSHKGSCPNSAGAHQ
jgi:hypothetical protein